MQTYTPAGDTIWEQINGLSPTGSINYEATDAFNPVTIKAGSGGNTFTITGVVDTTNLYTGTGNDHVNIQGTTSGSILNMDGQAGNDTVNVTNAGSVQGIQGTVNIENTSSFDTLTIDDSADTTARNASLATFTPTGDSAWEGLTGLAPGAINYELDDITLAVISGGSGGNTFNINSTAAGIGNGLTLNTGSGSDVINVHSTAPQTILTLNGQGGSDTINLDYTSGNPLPQLVHLNGLFTLNGFRGGNTLNGTTLDIGGSTIYVNYVNVLSDPLALVQSYLKTGYNSGAWNGTATPSTGSIMSVPAQTHAGYMIGYVDWADGSGINPVANSIELKYTLGGDLNLASTVVFADFAKVVADYGKPAVWDTGAITYGATVSFADFALTVANYGKMAVAPVVAAVFSGTSVTAIDKPASTSPFASSEIPIVIAPPTGQSTSHSMHKSKPKH
jgi:hypothetical protein